MKYLGGKTRHAKDIIKVILERTPAGAAWIEPFIGGASVVTSVPKNRKIVGSDIDEEVVALYEYVRDGGELPNSVTEEEYQKVRAQKENFPEWFCGFVSVGCSFGGKKWGGYARGKNSKGLFRNYALETKNKLQKMDFFGITLMSCDYRGIPINDGDIVYCDPPYAGTTGYTTKFNNEEFWKWANETSKRAYVFVSEYSAPIGWKSIWEKETASLSGKASCGKRAAEKLFTREI